MELRVAVVGAGPAGLYAADALLDAGAAVRVDVFDRLATPFGLVRYGVAPDHPKIKSIARVLRDVLERPGVRFFGHVAYGTDLSRDDLRDHYHAVVFATGAARHRSLGIPGDDLAGSHTAGDFVDWYNGHPDAPVEFPIDAREVAVVGAGNVALDVARILLRDPDELATTDVPDHVLAELRRNRVTDVHLLARRGPAQAKFTPLELRELGKVPGVAVTVHSPAGALDEEAQDRRVQKNLTIMRGWADEQPAERRLHLWFRRRPSEIVGNSTIDAVRVEAPDGVRSTLPVQAVFAAIGYLGSPVTGLPFDTATGTIPADQGRVLDAAGTPRVGDYVAGWIKRGPTGVIGTNKPDGTETARSLLADAHTLPAPAHDDPDAILDLLARRGVRYVSWDGWLAIEAAEATWGSAHGRTRVKITDTATLLDLTVSP